ncbi:MAG: hypothetical protein ACRDDZ_09195 [Marinifilaceae bacterium]
MKAQTIYILFCMLFSLSVNAQDCPRGGEPKKDFKEFEQQKVTYITTEMNLTSGEAAKFWPAYNEMNKAVRKIEHERRNGWGVLQKGDLTEKQTQESIGKLLEMEETAVKLKHEFYTRMLKQIPATKLAKLEMAEMRFHRNLINKLRKEAKMMPPPQDKPQN